MSAIAWPTIMKAIQNWVVAGSGLDLSAVVWAFYDAPQQRPYIELNLSETEQVAHDWVTYAQNQLTFPDVTVTGVVGNVLHAPAHSLVSGDGPVNVTASITFPPPLLAATPYWVIAVDPDHLSLAADFESTGANYPGNPITPITLTGAGAGVIQVIETVDSERVGQELVKTAQGPRQLTLEMQCFGREKTGIAPMQIMTDVITSLALHTYDLDQAGVGVDDIGVGFVQGGVKSLAGQRGGILEPRTRCEITVYVVASLEAFSNYIARLQATIHPQNPAGVSLADIAIDVRR